MELDDPEEAAAAARDPFTKLERGDADKRKAKEAAQQLIMLVADNKVKHRDDYTINKELRRRNRGLRKEEAARDEHRQRLNLPDSITLAPQSEQDRCAVRQTNPPSPSWGRGARFGHWSCARAILAAHER